MNATPEQFDIALAESQAFGPRRRIPIEDRWFDVLPAVSESEFAALKAQCKEIEASALTLAEEVRDGTTVNGIGQQQLLEKYPFLSRERRTHFFWARSGLGWYFAISH